MNFRNIKQLDQLEKRDRLLLKSYEINFSFYDSLEYQYLIQFFQSYVQNQIIKFDLKGEHVNKRFYYYDLNCKKKNHNVYLYLTISYCLKLIL